MIWNDDSYFSIFRLCQRNSEWRSLFFPTCLIYSSRNNQRKVNFGTSVKIYLYEAFAEYRARGVLIEWMSEWNQTYRMDKKKYFKAINIGTNGEHLYFYFDDICLIVIIYWNKPELTFYHKELIPILSSYYSPFYFASSGCFWLFYLSVCMIDDFTESFHFDFILPFQFFSKLMINIWIGQTIFYKNFSGKYYLLKTIIKNDFRLQVKMSFYFHE